ncbi:MAG: class I SAM-dependent methyltransferase [Pseudomonadota bacterium]
MQPSSVDTSDKPASQSRAKPFDLVVRGFSLLYNRLPFSYNTLVTALGYRAPDLVAAAIAPHLHADATLLDAGCGTGLTARAMRKRMPMVVLDGFDLSEDMLRLAAKTGLYRTTKTADATAELPFPSDSYDAAVSSGLYTLGHVGPEALEPVLACLRPGGLFGLNIYDAAWDQLDFELAFDRLVQNGTIEIVSHEHAIHFGRIGQTCRVIVVRKTLLAA